MKCVVRAISAFGEEKKRLKAEAERRKQLEEEARKKVRIGLGSV